MKKIILPLSLACAIVFGGGCASQPATSQPAASHPSPAPQFILLDNGSPSHPITCSGAQVTRTADGRMKVTAHLSNTSYERIEVQVNCVFSDAQGFTTDETPFRTLILDEKATQDVEFEAMHANAANYLVRARRSR